MTSLADSVCQCALAKVLHPCSDAGAEITHIMRQIDISVFLPLASFFAR